MAISPNSPIVSAFDLTTVYQELFEVPTTLSSISVTAAVFNNYSSSNVDFSVRIIQSGSGGDLNEIITERTIRAKNPDLASELIAQSIVGGGRIEAKASANISINVNITATLIS